MHDSQGYDSPSGGGGGNTSNLICPCPRRGTKDSGSTLKPDIPLCPYLNMHRASRIKSCTIAKGMTPLQGAGAGIL